MPNTAMLGASLTDHSVRTYSLTQGGLDVLKQPGGLAGVPIETISVTEAGPGGVSTMAYTVEDPLGVIPLPLDGSEVLFYDIASDHPEFRGFIQGVSIEPRPPGGRYIRVECQGVEAILDWKLASGNFSTSQSAGDAWQSLAAYSGLRDFIAAGGSEGTQAAPISGIAAGLAISVALSISERTLRDALSMVWTAVAASSGSIFVTVDFYYGLRIWHNGTSNLRPDDYISLTIVDQVAGTTLAEDLSYDLGYGEIVRAVHVIGSSDFGVFSDGTGKSGPTVVINDTSITSATQAQQAASIYMLDRQVGLRGSFGLSDFDEGATAIRAGANVVITDAEAGLSASTFQIAEIQKTYQGNGLENWQVSFGGLPPRGSALLRRLTRSTLS